MKQIATPHYAPPPPLSVIKSILCSQVERESVALILYLCDEKGMPWCLCKVAFPTISIGNLAAYEITARQAGAVDILRVAVLALVEVVLIGIEEVLHAGIHLERDRLI